MAPGEVFEVMRHFGRLAYWWLSDDFLEYAFRLGYERRNAPELPIEHGGCWIVLVQSQRRFAALRDSFLLPLCWCRGEAHSVGLPDPLRQLAEDVLRVTGVTQRWGLQLSRAAGLAGMDIRMLDMPVSFDSGWVSLAAGLLLAMNDEQPDPKVWATGAWKRGIAPVDHLDAKIRLAERYGVKYFFVPSEQMDHVAARHTVQVRGLQMGVADVRQALEWYLVELGLPPPVPTPGDEQAFARCVAYYLRRPRPDPHTTQFYRSHLVPCIVERLRAQVQHDYAGWSPTHLVTIVSDNPEVSSITAQALAVEQCLLLYDRKMPQGKERLAYLRQSLDAAGVRWHVAEFVNDEQMQAHIQPAVTRFVQDVVPNRVAFDMTPGTKFMTLSLAELAPPGTWKVYIWHELTSGRPYPGSERLHRWCAH
ncbi:MAG: hypothetical protein C4297_14470 [Gemmataceae bacterium]